MAAATRVLSEIGLLIYPDAQLAAVHGLTDLFRIAGMMVAGGGAPEPPEVRVSHWQVGEDGEPACVYDSHPGPEHRLSHVIVPPSLVVPGEIRAVDASARWLAGLHAGGATLCSVCAGAFVLGRTGLLEGRRATTHWYFAAELAARFPDVRVDADRMVIDEGDIITAGGILAWTDLGLTLVERLLGPSAMLETTRFLLIDPPGREQKPFGRFVPRLDHGDGAILKVQHWLHGTHARDHALAGLAERAGLEERTFLRRFKKATGLRPTEYAQAVRVAKAREELELTRRPIDQIAWDVGYGDPSAFRKLFARLTGLGPAEYRRRFFVG
ncbi:GlxA family transcriptional regulator [Antarcticirhabdus aurantiaca]|uniref:GlxA family transcriptional regulator n=1 Tax=Antarcticirhabdus aurantiaca TaxID=2606717 RepID=A0ACD4NQ61_9HYPH|nr:GlxA family transcriptional regulator [Antarcticirhabdus aurantiaca]WAJ28949.1 GlxA family transcriptional regulator [Jeongeuplla avenae]